MRRVFLLALAIPCLIVGAITLPTPLPIGAVLIVIGLGLLLLASPSLRRRFLMLRRRSPSLDRRLREIEHRLPELPRRLLGGGRRPKAGPTGETGSFPRGE